GRHRTLEPRSAQRHRQRLQRVCQRVTDRGPLKPAMCHAVVTAWITPDAVAVPGSLLHERAVGRGASLVGEEIARPLPAKEVVGGIAPRGALISLIAREKVEEQARMIERPAPARRALPAAPEDLAEQLLAGSAPKEHVLARRVLVAVTGRNRDALD